MFDAATYNLTFIKKKGTVAYITKNRVLLKKGCFVGPQNQRFRLKKGWFFSSKIREKGVFFKLGNKRGIRFGREWGLGVGVDLARG